MKKIWIVLIIVSGIIIFQNCSNQQDKAAPLTYTGSQKCQSCHQKEYALYTTSDHYHAMDTASASTVLANFNNTSFIHFGDTSFFYTKNNRYYTFTTDTTGNKKEFEISYTFGYKPLQQYLVKFSDGRLQVLPFCWDTRPKEKGGQRWFHLYDKERIAHTDELFWMGINQNWNYMCADCHTTDFKTNFNAAANTFNSSWKQATVSCESCHGPASAHIAWAANPATEALYKGFAISLAAKKVNWKMDAAKQVLMPEQPITNDTLIETCARCHARATRFSDDYVHGQPFLQTHIPEGVQNVNYYVDGQIKDEDYEYGSFLQSKMYAAGVTCINCHEPHSMKVKATGNALCNSCHAPAKFDGPQHSFHKQNSTGNQCVTCHMPVTTYMVVDDRLDHSIRIPRPDLSLTNNSPNACNKCHSDKTVQWAAQSFTKWFGSKIKDTVSYMQLKQYIASFSNKSEPSLFALLSSQKYPAIIRASAMDEFGGIASQRVFSKIADELYSSNSFMRLKAIKGLSNYPQQDIVSKLTPLLSDKTTAVRMEAMNGIAASYNLLSKEDQDIFNKVKQEYMVVQEKMSHRPEGFYNRAILYKATGDATTAEQLYKLCLQRFPFFVQAYTNLADLYREQNREADAKAIIDKGLMRLPASAQLHYASGLWYVRAKDNSNALNELKKAAGFSPSDAQMTYGYAIALFSTEKKNEAIALLEKFIAQYGNNAIVLDALISMCADEKQNAKQVHYSKLRKEVFGY